MLNPTQLSFVSLQVSDLDASALFYTEILGFKPLPQSPPDALLFEQKNGATFAIRRPLVDLLKSNLLGWGVALWFGIDAFDDFLHTNQEKLNIIREVQQTPFGRTVIVADLDGYWITLQEIKA